MLMRQTKSQKDTRIFEKLIKLPEFSESKLVLTYVSTEIEVDTRRLITYCFEKNIPVAVPGIADEEMRFFMFEKFWEIGQEVTNFGGSICVVPGVAFDQNGYRLGYGGGYYDRFLSGYTGFKIGICYEEFLMDIPVEKHDERVDLIVWK
jgi:5-formyltetrahydrofolate cyclo-ligase